jgi:hypothetical protein
MDFDSMPDEGAPQAPVTTPQAPQSIPASFDAMQDEGEPQSNQGMGDTIQAGIEGAGRGLLGPIATGIQKNVLHQRGSDILARQQQHPIAAGIGEATGLIGGALTGTGEAALMEGAGKLGTEALGLAKPVSNVAKIGSSAVQQAIEMSVLQGSDETSKMLLNDPDTSAETAMSNVGMAAALGAGTGAIITGAISPLWKATLGPKLGEFLNASKAVLNGEGAAALPEQIANDLKTLNVEPNPIQRMDVSDHPTAGRFINDLTRAENPEVLAAKDDLQKRVADSVMEPLGTTLDEMKNYDVADSGRTTADAIKTQLKDTFQPLWKEMDERNAEAALINVPDEERLQFRDRLLERGLNESAGSDDIYNQYKKAGDQVLNHEDIAGFDKMDTQLRRSAKNFTQDGNITDAQRTIRGMLKDFKNEQIEKYATKNGVGDLGGDVIADRAAKNQRYAQAESIREQLGDHFNIDSDNSRDFMRKLDNNLTPEQVAKKFSIKNNVNGADFLKENFPNAYQEVIKNEQKSLLKPAIMSAAKKGETPIDIKKLNTILDATKSGKSSYLNSVLPQDFINRAEAAGRVLNATNKVKDSGTPAGLWSVLRGAATSAMGMVGFATGHGFGSSVLMGELATRLGKSVPEALKLSYLKYLGSGEPVSVEGFKAMTDYFDSAQKGAKILNLSAKNVLKPGAQVAVMAPAKLVASRDKLDKQVDKFTNSPENLMASNSSPVGHYLPQHQVALSQANARNIQYLQQVKPQPYQPSPLDKPIQPTQAQKATYNRALDIANDPTIVLQHVKDGTLQVQDMKHLAALYPNVMKSMAQKLSNEMSNARSDETTIPYKTRQGMSLFLGQALDSSMHPQNIQAAQTALMPQQQPNQGPQQPQGKKQSKGAASKLGKTDASYKTATQAAESDRSDRE